MDTKISSVTWREPYSTPLIFDISSEISYEKNTFSKEVQSITPTRSFLHSQKLKQSLFESKKAFLNLSLTDQKPEDEQMEEKSIVLGQPDQKKVPVKKISFKVKKQSSLYRKSAFNSRVPILNSNKVAELTKKFNEMVEHNTSFENSNSFSKLVKRVNSINSDKEIRALKPKESLKVSRKPSVKTKKPTFEHTNLVIKKTKPTVERKLSLNKKQSGEKLVRAKIGDIEQSLESNTPRPTTLNLNLNIPTQIIQTSPNGTSVRAAIEIFEKKSANSSPNRTNAQKESPAIVPKPKVPEKSITVKTFGKTGIKIPVISKELVNETLTCDKSTNHIEKDSNTTTLDKTDEETVVQIINIPAILPQRRCDSMYETLNLRKITPENLNVKSKSEENIVHRDKSPLRSIIAPNNSFLWREKCAAAYNPVLVPSEPPESDPEKQKPPDVPPRPVNTLTTTKILKRKMPSPDESDTQTSNQEAEFKDYEEIFPRNVSASSKTSDSSVTDEKNKGYEEILTNEEVSKLNNTTIQNKDDGYEPVGEKAEDPNDGYEYCSSPKTENIYETLPAHQVPVRRQQQEPLPPRPPSSCIVRSEEQISNCYESIYNYRSRKFEYENNYESIYCSNLTDSGSNRDSLLSADQKSNSLYGKAVSSWDDGSSTYKAPSDLSCSDRSDDWVDVTDNEDAGNRTIIVREKQKSKKSGWSQHLREQWSKTHSIPTEGADSDSDHHYESLYTAAKAEEYLPDDYDSFDSESDSEHSFDKDDSGLDIRNNRLPDPPNSQPYGLMKFAGKHMKILKKNIARDFSKSLRRMTKRISGTDMDFTGVTSVKKLDEKRPPPVPPKIGRPIPQVANNSDSISKTYQNVEFSKNTSPLESSPADQDQEKSKSLPRKNDFWNKFRRSMSISAESANELTSQLNSNKAKSTFYLTETIDVDQPDVAEEALPDSGVSLSPVLRHPNKVAVMRPQSPPPPAPNGETQNTKPVNKKERKSSSWYAEAGLFRNSGENNVSKRASTCWYAEVGLYQPPKNSSPSTSSGENSGSTTNSPIRPSYFINQDNKEEINNIRNDSNNLYGGSMNSFSSLETKKDESLKNVIQEIQLRLKDEPLYQFYDAAVLESACYDSTSEFDSDNYEDVPSENESNIRLTVRPTAMELVSPKRNSICFNRTLWCEIPEVINSSVLSTLSPNQKKLQEAKFEMLTSEASYLNSLNVLRNHFVKSFELCEYITKEESDILFGKIRDVTHCSERLLLDLERCWQENILLHGVCDIVQKHAEENFSVYVPYCENQVILDDTLKELKERPGFIQFLRQLEANITCQSLSLYSFLMLPMQRITRWPLLIDAVLKRIDQQDVEYYTCQYALATLNKIVNQCNEAARVKERENELKKISNQLVFPNDSPSISILSPNRWLIRSGPVTHIQPRNEDGKLTFGRRFTKATLHLFIFNDLLCITREKGENIYSVMHFCPRNMIEINVNEGKNLLLLTVLENQNGKTVNLMLSCSTDSDKERWLEALTPPTSEDPEETLYDYWDCPQVTAIHSYIASQPDELTLTKGDAINVLRKMTDGWYHGERIRDGHTGWFPANHTVEVMNPHVRARNLKQRNRLLAFSENYLKSK